MDDQSITQLIQIFKEIPDSYLNQIENMSTEYQQYSSDQFSRSIQKDFGSLPFGKKLIHWLFSNPNITLHEIQLVIKTIKLIKTEENLSGLQLVWSGPLPEGIPIRDTEQVIIDLIEKATQSLFISSFAVYKAKNVLIKISEAIERGVKVSLLLETPESSHFKIKVDPLIIIPKSILDQANILIWPFQHRIDYQNDNVGSLHAKFIIQDNARIFISSANLTESAFERNIELGVVISDKFIIMNFQSLIKSLINKDILVNISKK